MLAYGFEIVQTLIVDIEPDTLMRAKAQKKLEIMRAEKDANEKGQANKKLEITRAEGDANEKAQAHKKMEIRGEDDESKYLVEVDKTSQRRIVRVTTTKKN
jgi:regulator of protease activity HflC (stomatin/prohibitin superfamily)